VWAVFVTTHSGFAIGRFAMWAVVELKQSCDLWIDSQNNFATFPTITAVRPTKWFELFAVNRCTAVATVTSTNV
jgi:hypothetical protein